MPWTKSISKPDAPKKTASNTGIERRLKYSEAILEATAELLASDPNVFVIGEGVDDSGGVFGTTRGLAERFGPKRVLDTPLAENAMTGIAIGAAIAGMRPILVHMRMDFTPLSMDQIINHAAKWHYMFGGRAKVPLTIRGIIGRGWGSGAQHSQSLHPLFAHIPGLKVVMPATPYDAKGLLRSAVLDDNPVIFIEHRRLFDIAGHVPEGPYTVEIGKAAVSRYGTDVTIAALSQMNIEALAAAETLENDGISCEVIDLRSVKPLDSALVTSSVRKTGRLIVAEPGWRDFAVGAELITRVAEEAIDAFRAAPMRITLPECPTPAGPSLEEAFYPGSIDITAAVKRLLNK
ncbi:MAG: pyruvate dehydrogenase complex E1 component subunit beta [Deltaproteobacteria bacterium]